MDIKSILCENADIVNARLESYTSHSNNLQKSIYEAMNYSLFAGGKRLRPIIMLEVCKMLGGEIEQVMPFACAIEMIHTYSLIHDDLPAMDNDDLRRGKPTSHKVFGEATAILAGDALLNKAFEIISSSEFKNIKNALRSLSVLSTASGTEGMIGGQVIDIESEGKKIEYETLLTLHSLKTGALISAAGKIGAIMAGANEEEISAVDKYCKNLGIAFQIQDDLLDVLGDEQLLGKPIGSDSENEKTTFVTLFGADGAEKKVFEYTDKAISALNMFGESARFLRELAQYLTKRSY